MKTEVPFNTAILLIIYNRPDTTARVFTEIRKIKPSKLYVAADGPKNTEVDREKCQAARAVVKEVDWDCDVKFLFSEKNLGCGQRVSTATSWFFENEPEGIVFEDDTVPHQDFFGFCHELLAKYRDDERIMLIGGNNFQGDIIRGDGSYYFGKYPMMWGWAGWRRAWQYFDLKMSVFPKFRDHNAIKNVFDEVPIQRYWLAIFESTYAGKIDTWDYQWLFAIWMNNGLCITPNVNLVSNIGCGHEDATHTKKSDDPLANVNTFPLETVIHPTLTMRDHEADEHDNAHVFSIDKQSEPLAEECEFVGDFSSWEEATKQSTGYDSQAIIEKVKNAALKVKSGEAVYERDSVLLGKIQHSWPLLSGLLWIASLSGNKLNLIDFGGALGTSYYQNRNFLKHLRQLTWNIVEQEHFVRCGKEFFEDGHLQFHFKIEDCLKGEKIPNTIILSGVLQYIEDPYDLLNRIFDLNFEYLLIDRTPFSDEGTEHLTLQEPPSEIYEAIYPHWFFNIDKFRASLSINYVIVEEFDSLIDSTNYPASYKGFILKRLESLAPMPSDKSDLFNSGADPMAEQGVRKESLKTEMLSENKTILSVENSEEGQLWATSAPIAVSVIICTFNRAHLLKIALDSLAKQTITQSLFEIIVVNNNCTDATAEVVHEFMERSTNCRTIYEIEQGLSHARNKGYKEANGKYVAYIDDDAKAPINWVEEIICFIERRPDVEVFGGPYYEYSIEPIPEWLPPDIVTHTLGDVERVLAPGEWIHGCNIVFSKSILEKYAGFNINLGMNGKTIGYGEETELLMRIRKDLVDAFYVPTMTVQHLISDNKITLNWQLKSYYADGKYSTVVFNPDIGFIQALYQVLKAVVASPVVFFKEKDIPIKRRIFYSLRQVFLRLGNISGLQMKKNLRR